MAANYSTGVTASAEHWHNDCHSEVVSAWLALAYIGDHDEETPDLSTSCCTLNPGPRPGDPLDLLPDRVRWHKVNFPRYNLQRHQPRGAVLVYEHAWSTLVRTFLMVFINLEGKDDLPRRTDGYMFGKITNL